MRAVQLPEHGGPDRFEVIEVDRPDPGPGEVLIAVDAAGLNPVDTYFREGSYSPVSLPFTPGVDVSGQVVECGPDVEAVDVSTEVVGTGIGNAAYQGAMAEYAILPIDRLVERPPGVDPQAAGAAGVVGVTAWRALMDHGRLRLGQSCLVHGGSGGVGHVAVQLARLAGAKIVTTAHPRYHERLQDRFAVDHVLDYRSDELATAITDSIESIDLILDHRLDEYLNLDATVAATGGTIVGIGENRPRAEFDSLSSVRGDDLTYTFMSMFNTPDLREPLGEIMALMATGDLEISIAERYSLGEIAAAHRALESTSYFGKLVLTP